MKKLIAPAALALLALLAVPNSAAAGPAVRLGVGYGHSHHHRSVQAYISSRASCGCPIYSQRVFRGRDRYGRPVVDIVRLPVRCAGHHPRADRRHWHREPARSTWHRSAQDRGHSGPPMSFFHPPSR